MDPIRLIERAACPICAAPPATPRVDLPYDAEPLAGYLREFYSGRLDPGRLAGMRFRLVTCAECGLTYQRDTPDQAFLTELYSTVIDESPQQLQERRGLAVRRAYADQVERFIEHWGMAPIRLHVLDFGAGTGMWLRFASAYGCQTAAVELAPAAGIPGADEVFMVDSLPTSTFHYVNAEQVFEHLVDPLAALRLIAGSLRPGGIVRIAVPPSSRLDSALIAADWLAVKGSATSLNAVAPLEHLNCYSGDSLHRLGAETRLERFHFRLRRIMSRGQRFSSVAASLRERVSPSGSVVLFQKPE